MTRGRHRRVVAPPTRLGASEEGRLTPTEALPQRADQAGPAPTPRSAAPGQHPSASPALPARAGEDTDEGWGELPDRSDDARYHRDRPPHWQ